MHTMQITSKATVLLRHKEKHKYKHQCGKRRSSYAPSIQHTHTHTHTQWGTAEGLVYDLDKCSFFSYVFLSPSFVCKAEDLSLAVSD